MLIHFGIVPYIIFDGDYLPSKRITEIERASKREKSRKFGLELQRLGKTSLARLELQKAVDVTPEMAGQFIEKLKSLGIKYLVAPYEADAELAYLERKGIIDAILSEDSDLLVFGAECLLTKLDQYGDCVEINRKDFTACRDISLVGWSDAEFRCMAILSGCDYLPNISGMGLKTAYQLVRKYKSIDRIVRDLAFSKRFQLPARYQESFRRADLTFLHQRVFCPIVNNIVMMASFGPGPEPEDFNFIGSDLDQHVAIGVSNGELHPMTKKPMAVKIMSLNAQLTPSKDLQKQCITRISTPFSQMKGNESIQAFFKTKRTPLAELDPNTFTPSSSQQRLLQQSTRTWMSSPAPARMSLTQSSESAAASASEPSARRSAALDRAGRTPQAYSHSLKRRRLCSEQEEGQDIKITLPASASSTRSRYFSASRPKAVSLIDVGKSSNSKNQVTEPGIHVWSDNCIDKVMAGLPDFSNCPPSESIVMRAAGTDNQDVLRGSFCTHARKNKPTIAASGTFIHSDSSLNTISVTSTAVTPVENCSRSVAKSTSKNISAEKANFNDKYSYQSASVTNVSSHIKIGNNTMSSGATEVVAVKPSIAGRGRMTPLQRLAAGALQKPSLYPGATTDSLIPSSIIESTGSTLEICRLSTHGACLGRESVARGSEDTTRPDLRENLEGSLSPNEDQKEPKLDFGRFVFLGQRSSLLELPQL